MRCALQGFGDHIIHREIIEILTRVRLSNAFIDMRPEGLEPFDVLLHPAQRLAHDLGGGAVAAFGDLGLDEIVPIGAEAEAGAGDDVLRDYSI